jgi:hypothetical protein
MYKELCEVEEFIDATVNKIVNFNNGDIVRFINMYEIESNNDGFCIGIITNKIEDERYIIYSNGLFLNVCSYYIIDKIKTKV